MIERIMKLFGRKKQYKQVYIVPSKYKRKLLKAVEQAKKFQTPYWDHKLNECLNMFVPHTLCALHMYISHDGVVCVREGLPKDWGKGYTWVKTYDRT